MAVAVTADLQPSWPPRVLVSVTGLTVGSDVEISRVSGGRVTPIRAGRYIINDDTSVLRVDAEQPFGVPVAYRATVDGVDHDTAAETYALPGGKVALSDAITGLAAEVVILTWPERAHERAASVFDVAGRNVVVNAPYPQFTGTFELFTETWTATESLRTLLTGATQGMVQVRQPGGYNGVDCYISVTAHRERRWSQDGSDDRRIHVIEAVQTSGWAPAFEARGYTLGDIADAYDGLTLADLSTDFATLLDVAQGEFAV